ncbi:DUF3347 domain-containing protein [Leeuwenhoekiella nanhaiensis]|uniref:DUF3347 domain-containing protein n=1 Tax=Leeuwenhoekiella nanhaiensis TaxID=1655491 RepID=A0A2G1VNY6_9FLAO|nr:DUF3347 domain-containing protein [Leeuwenhoekiella nanhaiensis]PHQ28189.1 hypothetical protein CJ305_16260 [Leeuwenhoekiella nanhaiensis]
MKKLVIASSVLVLLACGEKKAKSETVSVSADTTQEEVYTGSEREAQFENEQVAQVYDDYNLLKVALVNTDAEAAKAAASKMLESIKALEGDTADLLVTAQDIAAATDVNIQRARFEELTAEVKSLVEANITSGSLYYQYCPMAFDGKGAYWISNEEKVYNPYFGDVMLNCGTIDSKIE